MRHRIPVLTVLVISHGMTVACTREKDPGPPPAPQPALDHVAAPVTADEPRRAGIRLVSEQEGDVPTPPEYHRWGLGYGTGDYTGEVGFARLPDGCSVTTESPYPACDSPVGLTVGVTCGDHGEFCFIVTVMTKTVSDPAKAAAVRLWMHSRYSRIMTAPRDPISWMADITSGFLCEGDHCTYETAEDCSWMLRRTTEGFCMGRTALRLLPTPDVSDLESMTFIGALTGLWNADDPVGETLFDELLERARWRVHIEDVDKE